jgi:CheY-like chemotaxis protein
MKKKKVMVVDDEKNFLRLVKMNLEETTEYEVLTLSSAKDIVVQVNNFTPDIILLDLVMPTIGGIEACELLNNDPVGRKTPIIILSALDKEVDKLKAYKLGVVDYLTKPVEINDILSAIEKALRYR